MKEAKFDINALYKAVFDSKKEKFDSARDYYTILLDFPHLPSPFTDRGIDYFGALVEKIRLHLPDDALELLHVGENESAAELQNRVLRIKDVIGDLDFRLNMRDQPKCHYMILMHLDDAEISTEPLERVLTSLQGRAREAGDEVSLILTMPARMTGGGALLRRIAAMLPDDVTPFLFSVYDSAYRRHALLESVGAAIILGASMTELARIRSRSDENARNVENYIYALSEQGRASFANEIPTRWVTMYCRYHDTKLDFLMWYCEQLRKNSRKIEEKTLTELATASYASVHLPRDKKKTVSLLMKSLDMIPRVDKVGMARETNATTEALFSRLYGVDGVKTVDFSFKATLSMLGGHLVEDGVAKGAQAFLEGVASYDCSDPYTTAVEFLQTYVITVQNDYKQRQRSIRSKMDDEHELAIMDSVVLPEYVESYIDLYDTGKREDFWQDVLGYILRKGADCEAILARAAERAAALTALSKAYENSGIRDDHAVVSIPCKKPGEILEAYKDEAFCSLISGEFETIRQAKRERDAQEALQGRPKTAPEGDCSLVFALDVIPNTYTDFPVRFDNGTYSIEGFERNGQYLIYLETGVE